MKKSSAKTQYRGFWEHLLYNNGVTARVKMLVNNRLFVIIIAVVSRHGRCGQASPKKEKEREQSYENLYGYHGRPAASLYHRVYMR